MNRFSVRNAEASRGEGAIISEQSKELSVNLNVNLPAVAQASGEAPYTTGPGYGLWCTGLFGVCGIHRFYLGKTGTGVLWLLTMGLLGVGQIVDLFRMKKLVRDANIREGRIPHPRQATLARARIGTGEPERRISPPLNMRQQLLKAAMGNGGEITVSQGVLTTGKTFEEVEKVLNEMADKGYVDVDNAPGTGVVVYRFPELAGG